MSSAFIRCQNVHRRCLAAAAAFTFAFTVPATSARCDDTNSADAPREQPFFVAHIAGVNRLLTDADYVSKSVRHPEWSVALRSALALVGELKGVDRNRPAGIMALINSGEAPEPVSVIYVPITSLKELRDSFSRISLLRLSPTADRDGLYSLSTANTKLRMKIHKRYAFIARNAITLKRDFEDPAKRFAGLTREYDMALRLNLTAVPRGMKTMILDYIRAAVSDKSSRRARESREQYRLRSAVNELIVDTLMRVAHDGERLTLGWNVSQQSREAVCSLRFTALPNTATARRFNSMKPSSNRLAVRFPSKTAFRFSASWQLAELERRVLERLVDVVEQRQKTDQARDAFIKHFIAALPGIRQAIASAQLHARLCVSRPTPEACLLAVAVETAGPRPFAEGLRSVLQSMKQDRLIRNLKLTAARADGVTWNYFQGARLCGCLSGLFGGPTPTMVAGTKDVNAKRGTFWFASGTDRDPRTLRKQLAKLQAPRTAGRSEQAAIHLGLRMSEVLPLVALDSEPGTIAAIARRSFAEGNGRMTLELRTHGRELAFQSRFGIGYLRFLAELLTR